MLDTCLYAGRAGGRRGRARLARSERRASSHRARDDLPGSSRPRGFVGGCRSCARRRARRSIRDASTTGTVHLGRVVGFRRHGLTTEQLGALRRKHDPTRQPDGRSNEQRQPGALAECALRHGLHRFHRRGLARHSDAAFLAGVSAAPLLTMLLVYLLRRDDKRGRAELTPEITVSRSGGFAGTRGKH